MRLCFDDDLVTCINRRYAGVALYHAFAGGHFRGFIVGAIAFTDCSFAAFAVLRMVSHPLPYLSGIGLQAGDALGFFGFDLRLDGALVFCAMPFEHDLCCRFQFSSLTFKVSTSAALGLGGIARQLHTINGKHLAPDQTLLVADEEYLGEDAGDVVTKG